MNAESSDDAALMVAFDSMYDNAVEYLPQLVGALLVLVVGWLVARLLRMIALRLSRGLDRFVRSMGLGRVLGDVRISDQTATFIGTAVFWATVLIVVTIASNILGLTLFSVWLDQLVGYLPRFFSAALIVVVGVVIANLVRGSVTTLAQGIPLSQRTMLGRAAQVLTLIAMVIIGIDQVGIDVTLVNTVFAVVVAAFLGGLSIAFSLGARTFVANLLGVRYLGGDIRIGQRIRIDGIDGTVVDFTQTSIVLETDEGRSRIPGKIFSECPTLIIDAESRDG
jgi:small-conductance mechanosensitive channel